MKIGALPLLLTIPRHLKKEEKITETFLRKEDVLSKYLLSEKKNFLELFSLLALEDVKKGIANFEQSIKLNNSGKFDNLRLDAHYFIGKSYNPIYRFF